MQSQKEVINLKTLVNQLPVDPDKSRLPLILLGDRVLVKQIASTNVLSEFQTEQGIVQIIKPVNAEEDYSKGEIMSIGPGYPPDFLIPDVIKPGVIVFYYHQRGMDFELQKGEVYHMVRANDCFLIP